MAADLTSSSTLAAVQAAYDDNSYYEDDSTGAKAKNFIQACRILLRRTPLRSNYVNRNEVAFDVKRLREELRDAKRWYAVNVATGGDVIFSDFENLR